MSATLPPEMVAVAEAIARWAVDPVAFVREVLGAEPDEWQVEVLEAVRTENRICLKASKGPGKSTLLAWVILWFLLTRLHPKIVCTSITADNLRDGLWTELAKWIGNAPLLQELFEWSSTRVVSKHHPETWWASARAWPKSGDSSSQADTLAGVHADHVLFVLDEAGGIPDAVAAAAEGGLANASEEEGRTAKLLIAGNPTHLEGPLYRACTSERALWWVKEISGDPDDPKRAPRVGIEWAKEQIAKYGRDNPWVLVNVFGRFPPSSSNALFGPDECNAAMRISIPPAEYNSEPKVLGVDVARFGDDRSVIVLRQGRVIFQPRILRNQKTEQLAGQVGLVIEKHKPDAVFVDQATFGAGVLDRLHSLGFANVVGVDFGGSPLEARYANKRAEMYFKLQEWLSKGGALPEVGELVQELIGHTYKFDKHGKLLLEAKEELKKRIGVSPDIADACALTFAFPVASRDVREALHASTQQTRREADFDPYED